MRKLYAFLAGVLFLLAANPSSAQTSLCLADFERINVSTTANPLHATFRALPWHHDHKKPVRICWQFGDGTDTCINYPTTFTGPYVVSHLFPAPGTFSVCVKIRYDGGCEATKCRPIPIARPDSCRADFERVPVTSPSPTFVAFKALPQHNNNKKPQQICWRFGDGTDTCITYPENYTGLYLVGHQYATAGTYNVCIRIKYYGGCVAEKCKTIQVPTVHCSVELFELTPTVNSLTRGFVAVPHSSPVRRPTRVCWYFGDGDDTCIIVTNTMSTQSFQINHTYPGPGVYRACVKVFFDGGCIAQSCREVVIRPHTNICGGFMTDSLIAPRTYKFHGQGIHRPNDEVISYHWSFGDGTSASGRDVTHTYNVPGTYHVCLIMRTRLGCETKICKPLQVPSTTNAILHLSPNPVINVLNVGFQSSYTETVNIRVVNGFGTVVRMYTRAANTGPNTWSFDLSTLSPGHYTLVVQSPNQFASAIFLKL